MTGQEKQKPKGLRRSIKICLTLFFIAFILGIVVFLLYLNWILSSPASNDEGKKFFEIKKGESTFLIASNLKSRGLLKSDWLFFTYSKIKSKTLMPGVYEIPKNAKMIDLFNMISNGETKIVKLTIPEGYRTEQIGQLMEEKKLGNYDKFVSEAKQYEGKLFPDTYYFSPDYSTDMMISAMLSNYNDKMADLNVSSEDLIIASIVEREAIKDDERPVIAGVYKNRIAKKMKLEADPTVQYGKDNTSISNLSLSEKINFPFWKKITTADYLKTSSPFNTYIIAGLPPGPICNPGIKSIRSTLNYDRHNYLYFLQNDGKIYLSATAEGHEENKIKAFGTR